MAVISMRQMLEAGVHFGHQTRRWNPKMKRFIFGERNGIYIIDLDQTLVRVETAYTFVRDMIANGGSVLFVGTKKQAQDPVQSYAQKVGMPYVNERWLGGMLTNFETMSKRVGKMLEYERMKTSGEFDVMIKKEALLLDRELTKLQRNLGGLRDMKKLPTAIFVIDTKKEHIAVTEANKLGIPVIAIVDTNVDPDVIQFPIPGNDDAIRANALLSRVIAEAVEEGRYIASRRSSVAAAAASAAAVEAPKAERSTEEEAAFAQAQAEARNAAAKAQSEREARLSASKAKPTKTKPEATEAPPAEEANEGSPSDAAAAEEVVEEVAELEAQPEATVDTPAEEVAELEAQPPEPDAVAPAEGSASDEADGGSGQSEAEASPDHKKGSASDEAGGGSGQSEAEASPDHKKGQSEAEARPDHQNDES